MLHDHQQTVVPAHGIGFSEPLVAFGGRHYLRAENQQHGQELWVTDGTAAGTHIVIDILPGPGDSNPKELLAAGGWLYFTANTPAFGRELFRTDGTASGTQLVADLAPGPASSNPLHLVELQGTIYFQAETSTTGTELYRSDGTPSGTTLVADIAVGAASSSPTGLEALPSAGLVLFSADVGGLGREPWLSDGTTAGTSILGSSVPGLDGMAPEHLVPLQSQILFPLDDGIHGMELWGTDGTPSGTGLVADIDPSSATESLDVQDLTPVGGRSLYFSGQGQPWCWDPVKGLTSLGDLTPSSASSIPHIFVGAWLAGKWVVVFMAKSSGSFHPYVTDGTPEGTQLLKAIDGPGSDETFVPAFGKLFFRGGDGEGGLWLTNGTPAGTWAIPGAGSGPTDMTLLGDRLLYAATDWLGRELWSTKGSAATTSKVIDLHAGQSANPRHLRRVGDQVAFFTAPPTEWDHALWRTDGTAAGTHWVATVSAASQPRLVQVHDDVLYFVGNGGIWRSDMTPWGTWEVLPPPPHSIQQLAVADSKIYFTSDNELYVTDKAGGSPKMLPIHRTGKSYPMDLVAVGDLLYFAGSGFGYERRLYVSDGTPEGTHVAADPWSGSGWWTPPSATSAPPSDNDSLVSDLALIDGRLAFQARNEQTTGSEIYVMDHPGPHVIDLGANGSGHVIECTTPRLGGPLTVSGWNAPTANASILGLGVGTPVVPTGTGVLSPPNAAWLDPATAIPLTMTATSSWTWSSSLPADPVLAGLQLTLQAWTPVGGVLPARTSNGLMLVLGS